MLLALSQAVWAEPDPNPEEAETVESTTTTRSRSTYEWELETDQYGVTLHPPPPDDYVPDDGPITTTIRTSRTSVPFRINPDHPEDINTGPVPMGNLPNWNVTATDIYGNAITSIVTAEPTTETTTDPPTEEVTQETLPEEPEFTARPLNWTVAIIAGGALVAAAAGGIAVVVRNRKDDDYVYEEEQQEEKSL